MSTQREKAEELRRLHAAPEPLVLVNAWDAISARVVAAAPGARAIATASWSIAAAHGFADGEALSREAMIAAVGVVARAVELPVTADLERGYGDGRLTVECALEAGAVGCNLEDSDGSGALWPAEEHAAVVAAARSAGDAAGDPARDQRPHRRLPGRCRPARGTARRRARAWRRLPRRGRGLHLRPRHARHRDARSAREGDGRPDQRARPRRRPDAGGAGEDRRGAGQLRPGAAGRRDGRAAPRRRVAAGGR